MNFRKKYTFLVFGILILYLFSFTSCDKFEGEQTIPAYISIEKFQLTTDYDLQGSASHNISDVWVYVDDQMIGAFELPAVVPVLAAGKHDLILVAGIKLSGISSTRNAYPFYKPVVYENFEFIPDSIRTVSPSTTYKESTVFIWKEDFEGAGVTLQETQKSDTVLYRTDAESPHTFEGSHSAVVYIDEINQIFEAAALEAYELPQLNNAIFLELDFKIDNVTVVGLYSQYISQIIQDPIVYLNHSEEWKKIYVNLTPTVSEAYDAYDFKPFFGVALESGKTSGTIYLDNIKLVYRAEY